MRFSFGRWTAWFPAVLLVVAAVAATPWLVGPACPKRVVIATGGADGAYYAFAERYREILARDGIELVVRSTAGSIENAELLRNDDSDVSLALIQGGTAAEDSGDAIESLASLYLEPVWIFYRGDDTLEQLTQLKNRRIAVGPVGSGTRAVALQLLRENGVMVDEVDSAAKTTPLGGRQAVAALKRGEVDAAFFVISPQSSLVRELLESDGVRLMSLQRADAYRRRYPYLSSVVLSRGMLDLTRDVPAADAVLLAPTANLVARRDLHPALVPLLLKAAQEVHATGGFLESPGEFPSDRFIDYPLNTDAGRYLRSGPTMLYRYLPFRVAAGIDRMKLMLLPLCTLLLPLLKAAPPIYRWRIRSKIYRWYRVLREIDQKLRESGGQADFSAEIQRLQNMEHELAEVSVPLSYMQEFYNLRLHVSFVLGRLERVGEPRAAKTARAA